MIVDKKARKKTPDLLRQEFPKLLIRKHNNFKISKLYSWEDEFARDNDLPEINTPHLPERFFTEYLMSRGLVLEVPGATKVEEINSVKASIDKIEACNYSRLKE